MLYLFITFDFTGDVSKLKEKPISIKEGVSYKIKITFKVNSRPVQVILSICFCSIILLSNKKGNYALPISLLF